MVSDVDLEAMGYYDIIDGSRYSADPFKWYSDWVEDKIITEGHDRLIENTLGLVGEAGEVAEKVKKLIRDKHKFTPEEIASEIGDVIFYGTSLGMIFGFNLGDIIRMNVEKLDSRQERGVLQGSGDNR
jgi:NTP pyrophosphatase (non-canonical NTP hydrolase)|tara:strand:+ start:1112 stop:1495 length:384 start_codon:yes stop_codon:yes gene_type:complete